MAADETATFALNLESNAPAKGQEVAKALEDLKGKIFADMNALKGMNQALRNLSGGGAVAASAVKDLKAQIAAQKAVISSAQQKFIDLGGDIRAMKPASKIGIDGLQGLLDKAGGMGGTLGGLANKMSAWINALGRGSTATGVFTLATAALVVGLVAAGAALTKFGIGAADARRSEGLLLEGASKLRVGMFGLGFGFAKARDSGAFVQAQVDAVTSSLDVSREAAIGYASSLQSMGLRGARLADGLEGLALAQMVQGEAGAAQFKAQIAGAAFLGKSIRQVTEDYRARLGPIAQKMMLGLGAQSRTLAKSFQTLFSGLKIDGLLGSLKGVLDLFSQNTESGKALKTVVELIFQPIIDFLTGQGPNVTAFFEGVQIAVNDLIIMVLKLGNYLEDTFGFNFTTKVDATNASFEAGILIVQALAAAMGVLAINTIAAIGPWAALASLVIAGGYAWIYVAQHLEEFWESLKFIGGQIGDWAGKIAFEISDAFSYLVGKMPEWAQDIINGLVDGLVGGVQKVVDAVKFLGKAAGNAFKAALGIHSPSKVFADLGVNVPAGAALGIRQGSADVERAVAEMVPPEVKSPEAGGIQSAAPRGGLSVHIDRIDVQGSGAQGPDLERIIETAMTRAVVNAAIALGVPA